MVCHARFLVSTLHPFAAVFFALSPTVFVRVFGQHRIHVAMSYKMMAKTLAHIISMPLSGKIENAKFHKKNNRIFSEMWVQQHVFERSDLTLSLGSPKFHSV